MSVAVDATVEGIEALLRGITRVLKKRGRDILGEFDVTPPQFEALLTLRDSGLLTMGELCQKLYLACSTATDLIDRMERNGLIQRERDSLDRRVIRLKVTAQGERVMDQVLQARLKYLSTVTEGMSPDQLRHLAEALEALRERMSTEAEAST
ncbi:MAG: MarR family winged helix-turn-helix transcriptional regulator [Bacillota bacterium]